MTNLVKLAACVLLLNVIFGHARAQEQKQAAPAEAAQQLSDQERVARNKQTILSRVKRDKVEYRGEGSSLRVKSEWVDKVMSEYHYQKHLLIAEVSLSEKYMLRSTWVLKDMKVTFQEIFNLGPEDDEKLFPLSYTSGLLDFVPAYAWTGVTFLGKQGEVKGPFKRRIAIGTGLFPLYQNNDGKEKLTIGVARDAYTMKWKDLKNRVVDDMSEEEVIERLKLLRDKITFEESEPYR
jgi:hypothetical protein